MKFFGLLLLVGLVHACISWPNLANASSSASEPLTKPGDGVTVDIPFPAPMAEPLTKPGDGVTVDIPFPAPMDSSSASGIAADVDAEILLLQMGEKLKEKVQAHAGAFPTNTQNLLLNVLQGSLMTNFRLNAKNIHSMNGWDAFPLSATIAVATDSGPMRTAASNSLQLAQLLMGVLGTEAFPANMPISPDMTNFLMYFAFYNTQTCNVNGRNVGTTPQDTMKPISVIHISLSADGSSYLDLSSQLQLCSFLRALANTPFPMGSVETSEHMESQSESLLETSTAAAQRSGAESTAVSSSASSASSSTTTTTAPAPLGSLPSLMDLQYGPLTRPAPLIESHSAPAEIPALVELQSTSAVAIPVHQSATSGAAAFMESSLTQPLQLLSMPDFSQQRAQIAASPAIESLEDVPAAPLDPAALHYLNLPALPPPFVAPTQRSPPSFPRFLSFSHGETANEAMKSDHSLQSNTGSRVSKLQRSF